MCAQSFTCKGDHEKLEITAPEFTTQLTKLSPNLISKIQRSEKESVNDYLKFHNEIVWESSKF